MTALLDCDWLGYVHEFQFLEGTVGLGLCWVGAGWVGWG